MSGSWTPKQILLLDDEQSVMFALKLLLGALGYQVEAYCSPNEAIQHLKTAAHVELFICDLRMPNKNGLEVLEEVRTMRPSLPFVLMSAHADNDELEKANQLGANGFLSKPFTPDDLNAVIEQIGKMRPQS